LPLKRLPSITEGAPPARPAQCPHPPLGPVARGGCGLRGAPASLAGTARSPFGFCARWAGARGESMIVMASPSRSLVLVAHQHHAGRDSGSTARGHRPARSRGPQPVARQRAGLSA
jgi:hypothetical protein